MSEILKITKSNARKLYPTASGEFKQMLIDTFGEQFFSQKITDRIKTYEDAVQEILNIDDEFRIKQAETFKELSVITDALRDGRVPKIGDKMWIPYFTRNGAGFSFRISHYDSWDSGTGALAAARLAVFDEKTSNYFGTQFLYKWEILTRQPNS